MQSWKFFAAFLPNIDDRYTENPVQDVGYAAYVNDTNITCNIRGCIE